MDPAAAPEAPASGPPLPVPLTSAAAAGYKAAAATAAAALAHQHQQQQQQRSMQRTGADAPVRAATCRAAVLHSVDDLRVEEDPRALPDEPLEGWVRIRMNAVGICGSDVHYLKRGRIGQFVVTAPMVIGHEGAGTVAAVGRGVTTLKLGDRVALEPGVPCCSHPAALKGRYNLAPISFFATPPHHGCLAEYVDHPAAWCFLLPEGVSLEEGAMCEPLSVGVHACRRAGVQPGMRVAVMGAGPIGLVTLLAAKAFGADQVVVTDLKPSNLELATQMGADATVQMSVLQPPAQVAAALTVAAGAPSGVDAVIDCAGFESTMQAALLACASGGRVVLVGMGQEEMRLPLAAAAQREVDILGSFRYANTYPLCLSLLASGRVKVEPLITHRFGFSAEGVAEGFKVAHLCEPGTVKVMFNL